MGIVRMQTLDAWFKRWNSPSNAAGISYHSHHARRDFSIVVTITLTTLLTSFSTLQYDTIDLDRSSFAISPRHTFYEQRCNQSSTNELSDLSRSSSIAHRQILSVPVLPLLSIFRHWQANKVLETVSDRPWPWFCAALRLPPFKGYVCMATGCLPTEVYEVTSKLEGRHPSCCRTASPSSDIINWSSGD